MFDAIARPFGMLLMFFYTLFNNYGVAIIFFALIIKAILLPFQMKGKRGMMRQARLQPKIAELQKKHGTNKAKLNEETMKLYKEEGVNPASGCIWSFLPLPILLALFQVIRQPITMMMGVAAENLVEVAQEGGQQIGQIIERLTRISDYNPQAAGGYLQIHQTQVISKHFNEFSDIENLRSVSFNFLGIDLGLTPQWDFFWNRNPDITWLAGLALFLIPLLAGGTQFIAAGIARKTTPQVAPEGQAKSMSKMMMFMPLISVYFAFVTPAALGFYWTISTVFQIVQDVWLTKVYTKKIEAEEAVKNEERLKKEAELEAKRLETERKKAEGIVERNPNTSKRKKQKTERQGQKEKAAEWQKKNTPEGEKDTPYEPSLVGKRRYARGRAYDPDRYSGLYDDADADSAVDKPAHLTGEGTDEAAIVAGAVVPAVPDIDSDYGGDEYEGDEDEGDEYEDGEYEDGEYEDEAEDDEYDEEDDDYEDGDDDDYDEDDDDGYDEDDEDDDIEWHGER